MRIQTLASTSQRAARRHLELDAVVRWIGKGAARIENAARGTANISACRKLPDVLGPGHARTVDTVLKGRRLIVGVDHAGERRFHAGQQGANGTGALFGEIAGDAARNDAVHHHPVAEACGLGGEDILADQRAARVDGGDAGIVANGAHIAGMVRKALKLRHDSPQEDRARGRLPAERSFDSPRESEAVSNGAVSGDARSDLARAAKRGSRAERLHALMDIAEPFFETRDRLAIGREPEMAGLDDARMHGANRDLVQAVALDGQEPVAYFRSQGLGGPHAMIEPGAGIGQAHRIDVVEVAHRALKPHRGRMMGPYRRVHAKASSDRSDYSAGAFRVPQSHGHAAVIEPKRAEIVPARRTPLGKAGPKLIVCVKANEAVASGGFTRRRRRIASSRLPCPDRRRFSSQKLRRALKPGYESRWDIQARNKHKR